jgi:dTDP-4-amino-4,6-dideoxygalactose transaminase
MMASRTTDERGPIAFAERVLALPMWSAMSDDHTARVAETVDRIRRAGGAHDLAGGEA